MHKLHPIIVSDLTAVLIDTVQRVTADTAVNAVTKLTVGHYCVDIPVFSVWQPALYWQDQRRSQERRPYRRTGPLHSPNLQHGRNTAAGRNLVEGT